MIRVANAPVSYGAFELTVGVSPFVPEPADVLDAIAAAGYSGTELGPLEYFGDPTTLRESLDERGLELAGGFVPISFGDPGEDLAPLEAVLDLFDAVGGAPRVVLADGGVRERQIDLTRIADGVARAAERARERGYQPAFHHHMSSHVQTPAEVERLLELTDVGLLLDTGHLLAAGGDPLRSLRDWADRIDHIHLKDVRLEVLEGSASWEQAWQGGVFCELGSGDACLETFVAELVSSGYDGWVVVEQDRFPTSAEDAAEAAEAQARNRSWLSRLGL